MNLAPHSPLSFFSFTDYIQHLVLSHEYYFSSLQKDFSLPECLSLVVNSNFFHLVLQQIVASDNEDEDDAEAAFLASLTDKQKKKLLRYSLLIRTNNTLLPPPPPPFKQETPVRRIIFFLTKNLWLFHIIFQLDGNNPFSCEHSYPHMHSLAIIRTDFSSVVKIPAVNTKDTTNVAIECAAINL